MCSGYERRNEALCYVSALSFLLSVLLTQTLSHKRTRGGVRHVECSVSGISSSSSSSSSQQMLMKQQDQIEERVQDIEEQLYKLESDKCLVEV